MILMEWAQPFIVDSCFLQVNVIGHDIYDVRSVEYLVYCLIANHIMSVDSLRKNSFYGELGKIQEERSWHS